jgi:uncharacterized protein (DUF58 family)
MATLSKETLAQIRHIQIQSTQLAKDLLAGAYRSAFKGRGMEFEEVREYQPGDEFRSIDWSVTARMNHPYVKTFREERDLNVVLLIDVSASTRFGSRFGLKKELIAEIGAVLAFSAMRNQDRVSLILFSDHVEKYVPSRKGNRHVLRLVRELLVHEPQGKGSDLKEALSFLGKIYRKSSICFLISDFLYPLPEKALAVTAKQHDLVAISVWDICEKKFPKIGLVQMKDLETGREELIDTSAYGLEGHFQENALEHTTRLANLMRKIDAGFIDVTTKESYLLSLKRFFQFRKRTITTPRTLTT